MPFARCRSRDEKLLKDCFLISEISPSSCVTQVPQDGLQDAGRICIIEGAKVCSREIYVAAQPAARCHEESLGTTFDVQPQPRPRQLTLHSLRPQH